MAERRDTVFLLKARDPATHSIVRDVRFEVASVAELRALLDMADDELVGNQYYELDQAAVVAIVDHYRLDAEFGAMSVELHPWSPNDDLPYQLHTDRELAMMLSGAKPLAYFVDDHPSPHGLYIIPEREFEPHVAAGRIVRREQIFPPEPDAPVVQGRRIGVRLVLYALAGEEWRIDAYLLLLRKTAEKSGWNEGFERMEGSLLGYTDWQNDDHLQRRAAMGAARRAARGDE